MVYGLQFLAEKVIHLSEIHEQMGYFFEDLAGESKKAGDDLQRNSK